MTAIQTSRFSRGLRKLPPVVQEKFETLAGDPAAAAQKLKRLQLFKEPTFSLHVTETRPAYRAIARKEGNTLFWLWIGGHQDYDVLCHKTKRSLRGTSP